MKSSRTSACSTRPRVISNSCDWEGDCVSPACRKISFATILRCKLPILTGLSSTYLYRTTREYGIDDTPDDIRGRPAGHFVVISGWDPPTRRVLVVDPYQPTPYSTTYEYWISIDRVVAAILLGIVTHDANLLVVHPPERNR